MKIDHFKKIIKHRGAKIFLVTALILSMIYNGLEYWLLRVENNKLISQTAELAHSIDILSSDIRLQRQKNIGLSENLKTEKATNDLFQVQIRNITSAVNTLDRLSKTDEELLKKYSKVYFLNENYIPPKLTDIDKQYLFEKDKLTQIHSDVWPHLKALLDNASASNISLLVLSAYRSFGKQGELKSAYTVIYGSGANRFSAEQGYSEHQLGTTVDFTTQGGGAVLSNFEKTENYKWLVTNAYKYGFIMSYPKENSYYIFEPWHWRFVGTFLAQKLHDQNLYFYSLDQREIDQYLVTLFD